MPRRANGGVFFCPEALEAGVSALRRDLVLWSDVGGGHAENLGRAVVPVRGGRLMAAFDPREGPRAYAKSVGHPPPPAPLAVEFPRQRAVN